MAVKLTRCLVKFWENKQEPPMLFFLILRNSMFNKQGMFLCKSLSFQDILQNKIEPNTYNILNNVELTGCTYIINKKIVCIISQIQTIFLSYTNPLKK